MKRASVFRLLFAVSSLFGGCKEAPSPDAYGYFEAREWLVPADGTGKMLAFSATEGTRLKKDEVVGLIDTVRLSLQKAEVAARIKALMRSMPDAPAQLDVLREKRGALQRERESLVKLLQAGSVNEKQIERIDDELALLGRELQALSSTLSRTSASLLSQVEALEVQLAILDDQLSRCLVRNPEEGVVQQSFVKQHEYVTIGMPLYKLVDLSHMEFSAWFPATLLPSMQLGGKVQIRVGLSEARDTLFEGTILQMAVEPEFTPSRVQSVDNQMQMRYRVKIGVENRGLLKPGMPGEAMLIRE